MTYQLRIQKAINYIEENLLEIIVLEEVAGLAGFSLFHFRRIFHALVGTSVKDYIRKRRLDMAAAELLSNKTTILDIAIKNGYESHESFSRAFKKMLGITPGQYRQLSRHITLLGKKSLLEKAQNMSGDFLGKLKIVEKPGCKIVGMTYNGSAKQDLFSLWGQFRLRMNGIKERTNPNCNLGVYFHNSSKENNLIFTYLAGVEVDSYHDIPHDMITKTIPPSKYAVFTYQGDLCQLLDLVAKVYSEWLPYSGFEPALPLEIYYLDERFTGNNDTSELDIAFPIK